MDWIIDQSHLFLVWLIIKKAITGPLRSSIMTNSSPSLSTNHGPTMVKAATDPSSSFLVITITTTEKKHSSPDPRRFFTPSLSLISADRELTIALVTIDLFLKVI